MKRYIIKVVCEITKNHELYERYKENPLRVVTYNGKTRYVEGEQPCEELFRLIDDDGWESREDISLSLKYSWLSKRQKGLHKTLEIIGIEREN